MELENRVKDLEKKVDILVDIVADGYNKDFMLPKEVAVMLDIKLETVYRKVSNGTIPYMKDGKRKIYFSRKAIINNLIKHKTK